MVVVVMCLTPSCWQLEAHMEELKWLPLSEVMMVGRLYLATQLLMTASTQVLMSMVAKALASSQLLDRSMMVNRYRYPSLETVRGLTKFTWM